MFEDNNQNLGGADFSADENTTQDILTDEVTTTESTSEYSDFNIENESAEIPTSESTEQPFDADRDDLPFFNKINYTPVSSIDDYKPTSLGVKIFAIIIACIIALSSACVTGYFIGKNSAYVCLGFTCSYQSLVGSCSEYQSYRVDNN